MALLLGVNPPKGIVTQERIYGKRRNSDVDKMQNKRLSVDRHNTGVGKVGTTMGKNSPPANAQTNKANTPVVKQESKGSTDDVPQSALNYRNSMYHRGRWYTLPSNEGSSEATRCSKCMKGFNNRETFLLHNCSKLAKNYTCAYCDRACTTLTELGEHMENHVNERPFKCGFCPRSFNNSIALDLHVRTHVRHVGDKSRA